MKRFLFIPILFAINNLAMGQACPNGDFENWQIYTYSVPDSGWYNSNPQSLSMADSLTVWPVTGYSGQAVHIQTAIVGLDTLQAYVINTAGDPKNGTGGVPYTQQPTSINGYYRYNLVSHDSALMIIEFKKAGAVISSTQFTFRNAAGSVSTFTPFTFPLNTVPVVPDSVIIGIASSNLQGTGIQSGSWLEVDQLSFGGTGITEPIPGGSFDSWTAGSIDVPDQWQVETHGSTGSGVTRSTLHYSGNYSVQLTTLPGDGGSGNLVECGEITTGYLTSNNGPRGGLPYTRTTDTLTGYYIFIPAGSDTGMIMVSLTSAGSMVGGGVHNLLSASTWTYFEMPLSCSSAPDTMRIDIQSGSWNARIPGSVLNIDYLQLKSQPLPPASVREAAAIVNSVIAYPNPANDVLNFKLAGEMKTPVSITIYDLTGRIIDTRKYDIVPAVTSFAIGQLPAGMYFYEIKNDAATVRDRFIKE